MEAVLFPGLSGLSVASQIVGIEADVANSDLSLVGVDRRISLGEPVALKHVQQGGLAGVVQPQEHDVGTLLEEAHPFKSTSEEV